MAISPFKHHPPQEAEQGNRGVMPSHLLPGTAFRAFQPKRFHDFPHCSEGQEQPTKPSRAELALRELRAIPVLLDLMDHEDAQLFSTSEEASHTFLMKQLSPSTGQSRNRPLMPNPQDFKS